MNNSVKFLHLIYCLSNPCFVFWNQDYQNTYITNNQTQKNLKPTNIFNEMNQIKNDFSLLQVVYWHDNSPAGKVTNINTHQVDFSIFTKTIYGSINNFGENNLHTWINEISQTSHVDSTNNSGAYTYGNVGYDSKTRTPPWNKILMDYISLYIPQSQYSWTNIIPSITLDIENIWKPFEKIDELTGKKVFQNGNQSDYVYSSNEPLRFIKGINKGLTNKDYNVYAIPYTFIKEVQYIYVVYNYVSRYIYSLQTNDNPNKISYTKNVDNLIKLSNPFVNIFDPCQLLIIDHINYNNHQIIFGINKDIISLVNEYKLLLEKTPIYNFANNIPSNLITKAKTYAIDDIQQFINIWDQLKSILKLRINYEIYDQSNNQFKKQFIDVSFDDLLYTKKAIDIKQYQNKYPFKINSIDVLGYEDKNICLLKSENKFQLKWSSKKVNSNGEYLYIDKPQIGNVIFNDIGSKYNDMYPSIIANEEIFHKFFSLYDDNYFPLDISAIDNSDISIVANDLTGSIKLKIRTTQGYIEKNFNNFKTFNIDKFTNIDACKIQYGLITNNASKEIINQILIANNFDLDILNNIDYTIINTDATKGEITIKIDHIKNDMYKPILNKKIKINNFLRIYLTQNNNINILKNYQPSEITNEIFKNYLINISDGFKSLYINDLKIKLKPNDKLNQLIAEIIYDKNKDEFVYNFIDKNKISNYICYCLSVISVIVLIIGLSLYRRNKSTK